ncbi:MAG: tripartite ATP-independent transporter DctM subunit [Cellvibrionaceae bacterium]|jgi:tripartite ATP-independent transporter DctM subunit
MIGIYLFIFALVALFIGYPIALTFAGLSLLVGFWIEGVGLFNFMPYRLYAIMGNTILMAIPMFIFMGIVLQKSGLAERLLESMGRLFGARSGGLAVSTIIVGAFLAASTGVVGASVVAMGVIALPVMLKHGYDQKLATGTICAAGTLGQIIPPSIILIILGDVMGVPVGDLFSAAMIPGLALVTLYLIYVLVITHFNKGCAPPIPFEHNDTLFEFGKFLGGIAPPLALAGAFIFSGYSFYISLAGSLALAIFYGVKPKKNYLVKVIAGRFISSMVLMALLLFIHDNAPLAAELMIASVLVLIITDIHKRLYLPERILDALRNIFPPLILIFVVLGSILFGIATPTESSALGAIGALVLARIYTGKIDWDLMFSGAKDTVKVTSMVFAVLIGATAFSMVFTYSGGDSIVEEFMGSLPGEKWTFVFLSMLAIFVLGFFIDFVEIAFIVVPILAPIAELMGLNMTWFAIIIAMNLQSSFMTPPFGFSLFYLKGVAPPEVKTTTIYKGVIPFILIQLVLVFILVVFPEVLFLSATA